MARQNFAATASYFERRASKALPGTRKRELEDTAAHYRAKAELYGHRGEPAPPGQSEPSPIPARRRKLMELFQAYEADAKPT